MNYKPCPISLYVFLIGFGNGTFEMEILAKKKNFSGANLVAFLSNRRVSQF
jgi:hypothetical protein